MNGPRVFYFLSISIIIRSGICLRTHFDACECASGFYFVCVQFMTYLCGSVGLLSSMAHHLPSGMGDIRSRDLLYLGLWSRSFVPHFGPSQLVLS